MIYKHNITFLAHHTHAHTHTHTHTHTHSHTPRTDYCQVENFLTLRCILLLPLVMAVLWALLSLSSSPADNNDDSDYNWSLCSSWSGPCAVCGTLKILFFLVFTYVCRWWWWWLSLTAVFFLFWTLWSLQRVKNPILRSPSSDRDVNNNNNW